MRPLLDMAGQGKLTLDGVTGLPFWMLATCFAAMLVAALVGWNAGGHGGRNSAPRPMA
ncbi:hypothetical protein AAFN86_09575 [Roseomonas sp. CAU 1739]|uniref:hypothetical protein n=1 Tax=Roseomonas sp. CAU 1739 TaxID=3140364 RepID=UPI00325A952E